MTHKKNTIIRPRRKIFWAVTILIAVITGSLIIGNDTSAQKEIAPTAKLPNVALLPTEVYSNNFESAVGNEWRNVQTNQIPATSVTPVGARRFLGEFGNNEIRLSLNNLPAHNRVSVVFDLYVIRTWGGNAAPQDIFEFGYDGQTDLRTTFSNPNPIQAYPGNFPGGEYPAKTGASEVNTLGYIYETQPFDSTYQISRAFEHTGNSLQLKFYSNLDESFSNESWGIDNVRVLVETLPNETQTTLMPYESGGYRYQILPPTQTVPAGFEQPNYDDSAWSVGQASFGYNDGCVFPFNLKTHWQTNTRLILRKNVTVPAGAQNLRVNLSVDNDIQKVWFNGTEISRPTRNDGCPMRDEYFFDIPQNLVQTGNNVVAYQIIDRGRQTFFDSRITSNNQLACNPPTNGLVSWYRAEDTANDSFGTNNGTLQNGATFALGKIGQGFSFDGVNDSISFGNSLGNFGTSDFSFDYWIKTNSQRIEAVIGKRNVCDYSSFFDVRMLGNGAVLFEVDGGVYGSVTSNRRINDGNFHHITGTRQGNTISIYVDGVLDNTQSSGIANIVNSASLTAGNGACVRQGTVTQFFTGLLDELKFYNRALSATEISSIYATGNNTTCQINSTLKPFDFDGDGKTDLSIFRPNTAAEWWYQRSSNGGNAATQFGTSTDKPVPADYTGDGKTDAAFFRPSTGEWFILRSEDSSFYSFPFGNSADIPLPGDFDGDGKVDVAVFRPSSATWYINKSSGGTIISQFGLNGDIPVQADYDGDGKADLAIFRPTVSQWWYVKSSNGQAVGLQFGATGDKPVQTDYTGDGKTDVAVWRPSNGNWFVLRSEDFSFYAAPFGTNGDFPVPGDYDGDGKSDIAIFRGGIWYLLQSSNGIVTTQQFGFATDKPVPAAYIP